MAVIRGSVSPSLPGTAVVVFEATADGGTEEADITSDLRKSGAAD
jgi:hypothetical protein